MINLLEITEIILISFISIYIIDRIAKFFGAFDHPNKYKIHKKKVTKVSGLGLIVLIINSFILFNFENEVGSTLSILILLVLVGFFDDLKDFSASTKLILMIIPIIIYIQDTGLVTTLGNYNSFQINLNSFSFIFSLCCILLLTNAYNYIDGMDGLLGSISSVSLIFFVIFLPESEMNLIIPFIIFLLVFLIFNIGIIKKLPKVFMGDSGSIGLGFLFSVIIIHYSQNKFFIHESVAIWPVAFVVYEFLTINIIRIKNKKNPLNKDLNFIFNKLIKKNSLSKTLIYCNFINFFYCSIGYFIYIKELYLASLFIFFLMFLIYFYFRLRLNKF